MFILKSKEQLSKAIENAKALHPKVCVFWRTVNTDSDLS